MAEFNIGDVVTDINTEQRGMIQKVLPFTRGDQKYSVFFAQDDIRDVAESDLERFIEVKDLFDRCILGDFKGYNDFQVYNTTFKIENSSNNTLSSIKASRTMFKTYQYIPLVKFLNSDLQRLLIADEVGLGKTIEAGHIMLELKARGELKNVLVVCPSGLRNKWQGELEDRFGLKFRIFDKKDELKSELRSHNGIARGVISYDTLRDNRGNSVLSEIESEGYQFSLVVCDEAHRVRNAGTKKHDAIKRLLRQAQSAIFLTATPVMLGRENLFHLLNLLHSERYDNLAVFEDESRHNEPFVWALNCLNRYGMPLAEIREGLEKRIPKNDYVRTLPLFEPLMGKLKGDDTQKQRMLIQNDLYDINPLSSILSRTRKGDVMTDLSQAKRDTRTLSIELNATEQGLFDRFMKALEKKEPIARSTPQQRIASCIYAYDKNVLFDESAEDTKFNKLMHIIGENQAKGNGKVIVFAQFHETLRYLSTRLGNKGIGFRVISGEINDRESRVKAVDEFRTDESVTVLLSSEVGGEGLDMQFCDTIVNYDLPWNPMTVEQRIGRIDRIGQKSEIIHIFNMLVKGTVQEKIYRRLQKRIEEFRNTIGDLEPILSMELDKDGNTIGKEIENNLFRTDLTEQEREERLRRIERAIERNLEDSKKVERELSSTFTSDSYLREHLNSIINNKAYVTEQELENYVRMLFRNELPTCSISQVDEQGIAVVTVPQSQPNVITNMLYQYTYLRGDNGDMVSSFRNSIRDEGSFKVTFSQDVAETNRSVPYLSLYHPFVIVAKEKMKDMVENQELFRYQLKEAELDDKSEAKLHKGYYVMAIYNVATESFRYRQSKKMIEVHPVLYDLQKMEIERDDEVVDAIYRAVQTAGQPWDSKDSYRLDKTTVDDMRNCFLEAIREYSKGYKEVVARKQKNDIEHQRNGIIKRFEKQIADDKETIKKFEMYIKFYEDLIAEGRGDSTFDYFGDGMKGTATEKKVKYEKVMPARRGQLRKLEDDYQSRLHDLDTVKDPTVEPKLRMLNLIKVS